jgi:hypothetical protein
MANYFDQFDSPQSPGSQSIPSIIQGPPVPQSDAAPDNVSAPIALPGGKYGSLRGGHVVDENGVPVSGGNFFDQFDGPPGGTSQSSISSLVGNAGAGINERIANLIGLPVALVSSIANRGAVDEFTPYVPTPPEVGIRNPVLGPENVKQLLGTVGANPDQVQPTNEAERAARAAGGAIGDALAMTTGARYLAPFIPESMPVTRGVVQTFGNAPLPTMGAASAVGGATGEALREAVPEPYKPLADFTGNLIGAGGTAGLIGRARGGYNLAIPPIRDFIAATGTAGQQRLAGQKIANAASDVGAVKAGLDEGAATPLVPGSNPTLGQVSGDTGVMGLERARLTANNAPFLERRFEQNAARVQALQGTAPEGSQAGAVRDYLTRQLSDLDAQGEARVAQAQQNAAAKVQALGGTLNRDDYGAALRGELADANAAQKQTESAAWQAIDPNGQLNIGVEPIRKFAGDTILDLATSDRKPMGIEESMIFSKAAGYPSVQQFSRLTDLRSRLLAEIRQERAQPGGGDAQSLARMQALRQTMDDTIRGEAQRAADVGAPGTEALQTLSAAPPAPQSPLANVGATAFAPNGQAVPVRYRPVEASTLTASHNADLTPNALFPADLQPRERSRAVSELQVGTMAANLEPQRLGMSAEAGTGAPIVDRGGIVLSGNGRVAAIRQAFRQGNPSGQAYRQFVTSQFPEAATMREPILVREVAQDMTPEERVSFAQSSNASPLLSMGAGERAAVDAQKMPGDILGLYRGGDLASAENRDFVRAFLQSVPDRNELGALVTRDGQLSVEGQQRIRNALLQRAYGDSNLVASLAESGDENIRAFGNALADAAGNVAQLRGGIAAGRVPASMEISKPLVEAANVVRQARATGMKLSDLVAQKDAFTPLPESAVTILRAAYGDELNGRLSRARLGQLLRFYTDEAGRQSTAEQLFANNVTAGDIINLARARYGTTGQAAETAGTAGNAGSYGAGIGAGGQATYGPRAYAAGQGNAGASQGGEGVLPQAPLVANFGPENAAAYRAAADLTRERKQTFNTGPVGEALRPGQQGTQYRITNSQVPAKFFNSGSHAAEDTAAFIKAAGDRPTAIATLQDYAASDLIRAAKRPDGTLDPGKIETWLGKHGDALRAFPELARKFRDTQSAERAVTDAMATRKAETQAFQQSAARVFLGGIDPDRAVASALRWRNPTEAFGHLVQLASRDPSGEALPGLQRAVIDYMEGKLSGNLLAGDTATAFLKSDRFQTFMRDYAPVFERAGVFSREQLDGMRAIATDLQRQARVEQATKIALGSNTAQDLAAGAKHGEEKSMIWRLVLLEGVGELAEHLGGPVAKAAGWAAGLILPKMRDAGLKSVNNLVDEALLNPSLARALLEKVPAKGEALESAARRVGNQIGRLSVLSGVGAASRGNGSLLRGDQPQSQSSAVSLLGAPSFLMPEQPSSPLLRGTQPIRPNLLLTPPAQR